MDEILAVGLLFCQWLFRLGLFSYSLALQMLASHHGGCWDGGLESGRGVCLLKKGFDFDRLKKVKVKKGSKYPITS